jgi:hypothetical protein
MHLFSGGCTLGRQVRRALPHLGVTELAVAHGLVAVSVCTLTRRIACVGVQGVRIHGRNGGCNRGCNWGPRSTKRRPRPATLRGSRGDRGRGGLR